MAVPEACRGDGGRWVGLMAAAPQHEDVHPPAGHAGVRAVECGRIPRAGRTPRHTLRITRRASPSAPSIAEPGTERSPRLARVPVRRRCSARNASAAGPSRRRGRQWRRPTRDRCGSRSAAPGGTVAVGGYFPVKGDASPAARRRAKTFLRVRQGARQGEAPPRSWRESSWLTTNSHSPGGCARSTAGRRDEVFRSRGGCRSATAGPCRGTWR